MKKTHILIALLSLSIAVIISFTVYFVWYSEQTKIEVPHFVPYHNSPVLNLKNGQTIDLDDLNIEWEICENADSYVYNIILMDQEPNLKDENEASLPCSITLAKNMDGIHETSVLINKENLISGKWVKCAVAAVYGDETKWTCVYIKIN